MSTMANFPGTPALFLNADNIDGFDNALVTHKTEVLSWKAEGSAGVPDFTSVASIACPEIRTKPYLKKSASEVEVAFDGVFNKLGSAGSADKLNFLHTTGVFDIMLVLRRHSGGNLRRIFGCSGGPPQQGIQIYQEIDGGSSTDGCLAFSLSSSTELIVGATTAIPLLLGEWTFVLIRCDGERMRVTSDLYNWESTDFSGALGVGNAFTNYYIASITSTMIYPSLFEGDIRLLSIYSSNLSLSDLVTWKAEASRQVGVAL